MKYSRRLLAACLGVSIFCSLLNAQQPSASVSSAIVPRLVNFSGRAADTEGKIITGIAGATFAIYTEEYEGSPLWLETQNIQADAKGNYTVQLGATKPEGLPLDLFTSGEARWLGVTINGGSEQPRILLLSVPYALKAADAETLGGLPASAFALAAPAAGVGTSSANVTPSPNSQSASQASSKASSDVTTSGGTVNALPLFSTATNIQNSAITQTGSGTTAKIGINSTTPNATLYVNGATTSNGLLTLPASGTATATAGKNSHPQDFVASAYNSSTAAAVPQKFQWQAEPAGNDTTTPSGTLNLLYASGTNTPTETGLNIGATGAITFASGQTFPGTAQLNSVNTFTGNQGVIGTITATGSVGVGTASPATNLDVFSSTTGDHAPIARFGSNGADDCNSILTYTGSGITEMFTAIGGCFVPGAATGDGGMRVQPGSNMLFGDSSTLRAKLDSVGNASQPPTAGGWVKAMMLFSGPSPGQFVYCYNSTLSGAAASTPPCGITQIYNNTGEYVIDFGFQVDNRFFSLTQQDQQSGTSTQICTDKTYLIWTTCPQDSLLTPNRVEVTNYSGSTYYDTVFYLIVY
jgi:hypothetical protein